MNNKGFIATSILYGIVALLFACFMFVLANSRLVTMNNRQVIEAVKKDINSSSSYYSKYEVSNVDENGFDVYLYDVQNVNGVANVQFGVIDINVGSSSSYVPSDVRNKINNFNNYSYSNSWKKNHSTATVPIGFNGIELGDGVWYYHYNLSDYCIGNNCGNLSYGFYFVIFMTDGDNKTFPIAHFRYYCTPACFDPGKNESESVCLPTCSASNCHNQISTFGYYEY